MAYIFNVFDSIIDNKQIITLYYSYNNFFYIFLYFVRNFNKNKIIGYNQKKTNKNSRNTELLKIKKYIIYYIYLLFKFSLISLKWSSCFPTFEHAKKVISGT